MRATTAGGIGGDGTGGGITGGTVEALLMDEVDAMLGISEERPRSAWSNAPENPLKVESSTVTTWAFPEVE